MLDEQRSNGTLWSPSRIIERYFKIQLLHLHIKQILSNVIFGRLGERINDESSIYYWAAKNHIPVFSPALTDGSLGDMMFFHSHKNPGLVIDILSDIKRLNSMALKVSTSRIVFCKYFEER